MEDDHKRGRAPSHIIWPATFRDSLAILAVFAQLPASFMVLVHGLFIMLNLARPWTVAVNWRKLGIDLAVALVSLYVVPRFRDLVRVFAHAIVASSLGGGHRVFSTAVYATAMVETSSVILHSLSGYLLHLGDDLGDDLYIPTSVPDAATFTATLAAVAEGPISSFSGLPSLDGLPSSLDVLLKPPPLPRPLLFSPDAWAEFDWVHECPVICFQLVAVHVIGIGLMPYLQRLLPSIFGSASTGVTTSTSTSSNTGSAAANLASFPTLNSRHMVEEYSADPAFGSLITISVPDDPALLVEPSVAERRFEILYSPTSARKNKRLATVRANQPLWSTLASSIVLAARQEEAAANSPSPQDRGYIFLRFIVEHAVVLEVPGSRASATEAQGQFSIMVNGVQWPQVHYQSFGDEALLDGQESAKPALFIVIYGLTAKTQYDLAVAHEGMTLIELTVSTTAGQATGAPVTAPTRPLSPVTTLLETLTTMQITLSEEKSRHKRLKRDHAKKIAALRSDIDALRSKLDSSDKGDERSRRKVLSLRETLRQYEEEIETTTAAADGLEKQLTQVNETHATLESEYTELLESVRVQEARHQKHRSELSRKALSLDADYAVLASKREKLAARRDKLLADIGKFESETEAAISAEFGARESQRQDRIDRRKKVQEEFSHSISLMEKGMRDTQTRSFYMAKAIEQARNPHPHPTAVPMGISLSNGTIRTM